MKIGLQANSFDKKGYGRWEDNTYKKVKEHGYNCTDFDMSNTDTAIYTESEDVAERLILHEKALAEESGIEISQVHGPWRWMPKASTEEDRCERLDKMN